MPLVKLSRVMWDNYNMALKKNVSENFQQTFLIRNLLGRMAEGQLILCDLLAY